jgi:hypothetical protein
MILLSFSPTVELVSTDVLRPELLDSDFFVTPDLSIIFCICTVGGEGSSNVQRCQDALPFNPRLLDIGDEQESCNQDADSSTVQVQDSCTRLLVPSCRHDSTHDPQLPEDWGKWYQ